MKKAIIISFLIIILMVLVTLGILMGRSASIAKKVRAMPINEVDLAEITDGSYKGDFTYAGFTYQVEVMIKEHKIENIKVLKNRNTKYSKLAEGIIEKVVQNQSLKVDAISGATTTSKALLKAIENALTGQGENTK